MYVGRQHHLEHELLRWLILIVLAGALILLSARPTPGEEPMATLDGQRMPPTAEWIWKILEDHDAGHHASAILRWNPLAVTEEAEPWKRVAVATAYLKLAELDHAACTLNDAIDEGYANAVTHHLAAVVKYAQSNAAMQAEQPEFARRLRELARMHFHETLAMAEQVDLDQPLIEMEVRLVTLGPHDTIHPNRLTHTRAPLVRDLMVALDLLDYQVKTHLGLAEVNLADGLLMEAETHLDAAAELGEDVTAFYRVLGDKYWDADDAVGANRVTLKMFAADPHKASIMLKGLKHLR